LISAGYITPPINLTTGWNAFGIFLNESYYVNGDINVSFNNGTNLVGFSIFTTVSSERHLVINSLNLRGSGFVQAFLS
jgi:hypothetical protein